MTRPRIAFVGRAVHEKTRSDRFLMDILSEVADLKMFRREAMNGAELVEAINRFNPDQTLFFQLPPSISNHLLPIKSKNFVWVPMWDGFKKLGLRRRLFFRYFRVRSLCFSHSTFKYVRNIGQNALHVRCYPRPEIAARTFRDKPPYTLFLWQRTPQLGVDEVVQIVGRENIAKIILKSDFDVTTNPAVELQRIPEWLPENEYKAMFNQIDYYVAPRFQEGIGFSFLEALSRGIPVIGHDEATMNEYIVDGQNSLLFDDRFQLKSGLVSPARLRPALIADMNEGHQHWLKAIPSVQAFILGNKPATSGCSNSSYPPLSALETRT
jgi:hypothetical protein